MNDHPLKQLSIRAAVVRQYDIGYILACNPETEEDDPHTKIFKWNDGKYSESWANFNAHTICLVSNPDVAIVFLSVSGNYGIQGQNSDSGIIFEKSKPQPKVPRFGDIRSVTTIDGKAYAVGYGGMVYRLDDLKIWTRIDENLSSEFDIEAIHGFSATDVYAVGFKGEIWHFNGASWSKCVSPTNINLTAVKCAGDGYVYATGHKGLLIRGRGNAWGVIDQEETLDDLWGIEYFKGELYVSSLSNVYKLKEEQFELVNFGDEKPNSYYKLSATTDVMWSIGGTDIMSFDSKKWNRIV